MSRTKALKDRNEKARVVPHSGFRLTKQAKKLAKSYLTNFSLIRAALPVRSRK